MFHNTLGGKYLRSSDGLKTAYTFPNGASFSIGEIHISLSDITVECYGSGFDAYTITQMAQAASLVKPQKTNIYNTSIFVTDQQLLGIHYPTRDDFNHHGIEYLPHRAFLQLQNEVESDSLPPDHPKALIHRNIVDFAKQFNRDTLQRVRNEIKKILENNDEFPKNISLIYDDRIKKHTAHIVLSFANLSQCVLIIDNTLSPLFTFIPKETLEKISSKIDPLRCAEVVSENSLTLYDESKGESASKITLLLGDNINDSFLRIIYSSMRKNLQKLGFQITNIEIRYSQHNQKNTLECVPFSIQNKLEYAYGSSVKSNESVGRIGIRLRAEHAVLIYFLTGANCILRFNDQDAHERNVHYNINDWYANYPEVCKQLSESIDHLPSYELEKLYTFYDSDNETKLSLQFKEHLRQLLRIQDTSLATTPFGVFAANKYETEKSYLERLEQRYANLSLALK